jgi:excisionase family DNA binding protein
MNNVVLNFPYSTIEEFENSQEELIERTLLKILKHSKSDYPENLTRKQAAEYLRISLSTLNNYTKQGYIQSYRVGRNRIVYKRHELDEAMRSIDNKPKFKRGEVT